MCHDLVHLLKVDVDFLWAFNRYIRIDHDLEALSGVRNADISNVFKRQFESKGLAILMLFATSRSGGALAT